MGSAMERTKSGRRRTIMPMTSAASCQGGSLSSSSSLRRRPSSCLLRLSTEKEIIRQWTIASSFQSKSLLSSLRLSSSPFSSVLIVIYQRTEPSGRQRSTPVHAGEECQCIALVWVNLRQNLCSQYLLSDFNQTRLHAGTKYNQTGLYAGTEFKQTGLCKKPDSTRLDCT